MTTEPKTKGRKAKGRKYTESLQVPVTPEQRLDIESMAEDLGMTVPEFMRRAAEFFIVDPTNAEIMVFMRQRGKPETP